MKKSSAFALVFAALVIAGCTVKEGEDAEGDKTYDVEPANIEVGTDTHTVKIPDIDIVADSTPDTTTN